MVLDQGNVPPTPGAHLVMSGSMFGCHNWKRGGQRLRVLLNILSGTGRLPTTKNDPAPMSRQRWRHPALGSVYWAVEWMCLTWGQVKMRVQARAWGSALLSAPGDVDMAGPLSTKGSAGHMQCSTCLSCAALLKNLFPKPIVSGLHDSTLPAMVPILQQTLETSWACQMT